MNSNAASMMSVVWATTAVHTTPTEIQQHFFSAPSREGGKGLRPIYR
jgi:hypothetical protein